MSVDIDWQKLDSELAGYAQQFLNKHFQTITKPSFIGDVQVTDFQWGTEAPQIEITNITDPFPEFYEQDETELTDGDNVAASTVSKNNTNTMDTESNLNSSINSPSIPLRSPSIPPSEFFSDDGAAGYNTARLSLNTQLSQQQRFNFMHSFHRSPFVAPQHPFNNTPYFGSPPSIPVGISAWTSQPSSVVEEDWIDDEEINRVSNPSIPPSNSASILNKASTEMDFQVHMNISYKGDMSMTVITELRMNYPSVMFMSLPINLRVRSVEFEATAVVAYIQSLKRVCVSMLEPQEDPLNPNSRGKDIGMGR